jgi:hypothetical protein
LQPFEKDGRHLVVFVLLLQELNGQALPLILKRPVASTNLKCDACNTEGRACYWVELKSVNILPVLIMRGLTWANIAPILIAPSTTLSTVSDISGENFSNNPSSSWSDRRRDSAYVTLVIGWDEELQKTNGIVCREC